VSDSTLHCIRCTSGSAFHETAGGGVERDLKQSAGPFRTSTLRSPQQIRLQVSLAQAGKVRHCTVPLLLKAE
jgi:hypothetical protein